MTVARRRFAALVLAIVVAVIGLDFLLPFNKIRADGETSHYATWEEARPVYFPDSTSTNMNEVAYAIDMVLEACVQNYSDGYTDAAYECAQDAYYGYYEVCGFERQTMSRISGSRKNAVEFQYKAIRQVVKNGGTVEELQEACDGLMDMLYEDALLLSPVTDAFSRLTGQAAGSGTNVSSGAFFLEAFIILVREGLEAILVIGGIIAYLIKSGNKKQVRPVYIGSVIAIGLSFVAAWILSILKARSAAFGASQEVIEGVTALLAVAVLFYVSNWMLSKSESEVWQKYINDKVEGSVSKGSMFALGFTAFLAVFREGAEVILFYQPMLSDAKDQGIGYAPIWLGVLASVVVLAVVFVLIRFFSIRLPLKPFFLATSILMAVMSIAFLGSGIKELIEGDAINLWNVNIPVISALVAKIPENDILDTFGVYPHIETVVPQLILLVITIILFVVSHIKSKKLKAEIAAKAAEEPAPAAGKEDAKPSSDN